ncbi:MAG: OmpA family protein [Amphritea sp.]
MKILNSLLIALISLGSQAALAENTVNGYVNTNSDTNWKTSANECWRTGEKTTLKDTDCGYDAPVEPAVVHAELVVAPTAATLTKELKQRVSIEAFVLFDFDSAVLSNDGKNVIAERIRHFDGHIAPDIPVRVTGHTDSIGSDAYNQLLSEKRAQSIAQYLKNHSFLADNEIRVHGAGENLPIASNDTSDGRRRNRRVEMFFVGHTN